MTPAEILKKAKEKISTPEKWAKGWFAFDADGERCYERDPSARCFCSAGAINAVGGFTGAADRAMDLLQAEVGSIAVFNDAPERTHDEVIAAFDRAIARAEGVKQPQPVEQPVATWDEPECPFAVD